MKIFVPLRKHTVRIVPCIFIALLSVIAAQSYAISYSTACKFSSVNSTDSIVVEKQITSKKFKIKLYPNVNQQVLFFSASGQEGKLYQLFLFDIDGRLVKQANIRNKQTTVIDNIEKGIYMFEVFSNDERIENGRVIVR